MLRFITRSDLWLDEALSVNIARLPLSRIPDALRHDGSPPLYYLALHLWMGVFGTGDAAVRALSGLFSVATLPVVWTLARRRAGKPVAWAAVLLAVSSPFAVRYGTEARMYALVMLLSALCVLGVERMLRSRSAVVGAAVAVLSGLLLLTHYWSFYLLGALAVGLVVRFVRSRDTASLWALAALSAGGVLFVPWVPGFLFQMASTGTPWGRTPTVGAVFASVHDWSGGGSDAAEALDLVLITLAALALLGAAIDERRIELDMRTRPGARGLAALTFGTLALGIVASRINSGAFAARYTSVVFPFFMVVAAVGTRTFVRPGLRHGVLAVAVVLSLLGCVHNAGGRRTEAGRVARALNAAAAPGDVVGYCPDQLGPAVNRLLHAPVVELTFPSGGRPERVDWVDYRARNRAARSAPFAQLLLDRAGDHDVWVVWSPGYRTFGTKCSALLERLKAARPGMHRVVKVSPRYEERLGLVRYPAA